MMTEQTGRHQNPNGAPLATSNGERQEAERPPATLTGVPRRACLTNPGEPLLLARDPIESVIRVGQFAEQSGIDTTELVSSHTVAVPLPLWPQPWPTGTRRWKGTRAELWHPLMWLPEHLANRVEPPVEPNGRRHQESDDEWATRVALEMTVSGLYDQTTGTWLDVLAIVGIDIDRPRAQARVAAWLAGRPDSTLDGIDLTNLTSSQEDPHWSSWAAVDLAPVLRRYSWALGSDALIDTLDSLPAEIDRYGMDRDAAVAVATTVATVGSTWIDGVPDSDAAETLRQSARHLADSTPSSARALIADPVARISPTLLEIRERFWPAMTSKIAELGNLAGGMNQLLERHRDRQRPVGGRSRRLELAAATLRNIGSNGQTMQLAERAPCGGRRSWERSRMAPRSHPIDVPQDATGDHEAVPSIFASRPNRHVLLQ